MATLQRPPLRGHGRVTGLVSGILAASLLLVSCDGEPDASPQTGGLLIVSGELGAVELVVRDSHDPTGRVVELPDPATSWVSAGRANVLMTTLIDGRTFVSDPLDDDVDPGWRPVEAVGVDDRPVEGPLYFGAWDPAGGAFVLLGSDFGEGSGLRIVVVDPALEGASEAAFPDTTAAAAAPTWVDDDRVAVVVASAGGPSTLLVDTATGDAAPGPTDVTLVATSADALMTAVWRGDGPVEVLATEAWLTGDPATIRLDPPDGASRPGGFALDATGSRLAIVWLDASDAPLAVAVHERARDWSQTTRIGLDGAAVALVAWLR
jgi:hypothetical protein